MSGKICPNNEIYPSLQPISSVQLSTWKSLAYIWLKKFFEETISFKKIPDLFQSRRFDKY